MVSTVAGPQPHLERKEATLNVKVEDYCRNQSSQKRETTMKPLNLIYWTKMLLGAIVGLISGALGAAAGNLSIAFNLFNGISIALLVYIIVYYVYKRLFLAQVGKTTKLLSTGIGGYFLTWVVVFALVFTLLSPIVTITSPASNASFKPGDIVTVAAYVATPLGTTFSNANVTATISLTNATLLATVKLNPTSVGSYAATFNVTSVDPVGDRVITVTALADSRYLESASITVHIISGT